MAIWHGDRDGTVVPGNAGELRDQWTAVHGLDHSPDRSSVIGPDGTRREQYLAADGSVAVEVDRWNGGLVVAGSPGVREQYANDRAIGDWALS